MKLTTMVAVVLRLFAINWAVACCVALMGALGMVGMYSGGGSLGGLQATLHFAVPTTYGALALLSWIFARAISQRAVQGDQAREKIRAMPLFWDQDG